MATNLHLDPAVNMPCAVCEALCVDAVDGLLAPAEQAAFDLHIAGCTQCAHELAEARRGAAWMEMLKGHTPAPPAQLLQRILAETTGAQAAAPSATAPLWVNTTSPKPSWLSGLRARFSFGNGGYANASFQPRMAMTAAMAFFSIALTLNLGGIRLTDLRPSALHRTFADKRAGLTRTFQNQRMVYQVESRVEEFRRGSDGSSVNDPAGPFRDSNDPAPAAQPKKDSQKPDDSAKPQGTSKLEFAAPQLEQVSSTTAAQPLAMREGV